MSDAQSLAPPSATPFEHAFSKANDLWPHLQPALTELARGKYEAPHRADVLPVLIDELGLGEISRFFDDKQELVQKGVQWQRLRGTPASVSEALSWLAYGGALEEAPLRWLRWTTSMLALDRLRDAEDPDLADIDEVVSLSLPERSHFVRGFHGYDVRALEWSYGQWGETIWGDHAGARLAPGGVQWSFGRSLVFDMVPGETELTALGAWLPLTGDADFAWEDTEITWEATEIAWEEPTATVRRSAIISALLNRPVWVEFRDTQGIIGCKRCRYVRGVTARFDGPYRFFDIGYAPSDTPSHLLAEALTDFGDGHASGRTATELRLRFDSLPTYPDTPGLDWATDAELTAGTSVVLGAASIPFARTVRDSVQVRITV